VAVKAEPGCHRALVLLADGCGESCKATGVGETWQPKSRFHLKTTAPLQSPLVTDLCGVNLVRAKRLVASMLWSLAMTSHPLAMIYSTGSPPPKRRVGKT
jgi:hypothetical protein